MALNTLPASVNQYECSIATPRSNCAWTFGLQEVGNLTFPSISACWAKASLLRADANARNDAMSAEIAFDFIVVSPRRVERQFACKCCRSTLTSFRYSSLLASTHN